LKGFSRPARLIILFQTLIIAFLSFWVYQEYLNNLYLRIYVDNTFRTTGWAVILLVMVFVLGFVMIVVSRHRSGGKRTERTTVEEASFEAEPPTPTVKVSAKADVDLHPIVAQLKAELARTPIPVEDTVVPQIPQVEERQEPRASQPPAPEPQAVSPTPATVIVGMVPSKKKEQKEEQAQEKSEAREQAKESS
jgi:hypothetical protein